MGFNIFTNDFPGGTHLVYIEKSKQRQKPDEVDYGTPYFNVVVYAAAAKLSKGPSQIDQANSIDRGVADPSSFQIKLLSVFVPYSTKYR